MLRYPPFNMQAVRTDEGEEDSARASLDAPPWRDPAGPPQRERKSAMTSGGQPLVALERRRGTKGLMRCIEAPVSQRGTHGALPQGGLRPALGLNL